MQGLVWILYWRFFDKAYLVCVEVLFFPPTLTKGVIVTSISVWLDICSAMLRWIAEMNLCKLILYVQKGVLKIKRKKCQLKKKT